MSFDNHKNLSYSVIAVAPSPAASGTSLTVTTGEGTRFPSVPFNATIWPISAIPIPSNAEIVRVTGIAGDVLTIVRAQESTSARTVLIGDQIAATITAKTLTDIETVDAAAGTGSLRTLGNGAQQAAGGTDSRLSDSRTPLGHHTSHEPAGSDPMAVDAVAGTGSLRTLGSGAQQAAGGTDSRLSDARTPTGSASGDLTGTYPGPTIAALAVTDAKVATANKDGAVGTASMRTLGTGATQATAGNDSRLSDSRTPLAHAASHKSGGSDSIKLDEFAAPTDVTTLNATSSLHGLLPKLSGSTTTFFRGDGTYTAPYLATQPQDAADVTIPASATLLIPDYLEIPASQMWEAALNTLIEILGSGDQAAQDTPAVRAYPSVSNGRVEQASYASVTDYYEVGSGFYFELSLAAIFEIEPSNDQLPNDLPSVRAYPTVSNARLETNSCSDIADMYDIGSGLVAELDTGSLLEILPSGDQQANDVPSFRAYPTISNGRVEQNSYAAVADYLEVGLNLYMEFDVNSLFEVTTSWDASY